MHEHLTRLADDLPLPTLSEAHTVGCGNLQAALGFASACMELTTIRHLRRRWGVKHYVGGNATTDPLRGSYVGIGYLQAALRLRLRLHGVNHNTPSPMARC